MIAQLRGTKHHLRPLPCIFRHIHATLLLRI